MERNRPAAAVAAAIGRWTARSPGTYVWLTVLLVTSHVLGPLLPAVEEFVRLPAPADPHTLVGRPFRVFPAGLLWLPDGGHWMLCAVLFTLFHAPAEQWLGTLRWCAVVAVAYVPAGLLTEAVLLWAVRHGHAHLSATTSLVYAADQGLAGIAAVLTHRLPRVWRYAYAFAVLVFFGVPLGAGPDVTDLGRFTAALAGLGCYPLTRRPHPPRAPPSGHGTGRSPVTSRTRRARPGQALPRPPGGPPGRPRRGRLRRHARPAGGAGGRLTPPPPPSVPVPPPGARSALPPGTIGVRGGTRTPPPGPAGPPPTSPEHACPTTSTRSARRSPP